MSTYIHFTKDVFKFAETRELVKIEKTSPEMFSDEGLFVYEYNDDFPLEERRREWGYRDPVFIECPAEHVTLVQTDPIGDDCHRDEYMIPIEHFDKCSIWFES